MIKTNMKKVVAKAVSNAGKRAANASTNQACACFIYQPKMPKSLKKDK